MHGEFVGIFWFFCCLYVLSLYQVFLCLILMVYICIYISDLKKYICLHLILGKKM